MKHFSDIAAFAEQKGLCSYNQTINLMIEDRFIPGYERKTVNVCIGHGNAYGYSEQLTEILNQFVQKHAELGIGCIAIELE